MSKVAFPIIAAVLLATSSGLAQNEQENPEQRAYEGRMDTEMRTWIHEGNHAATDEERQFIKDHWDRAEKLWRIRALAQAANDTATVNRVDGLILRGDKILEDHMMRFREHAPVLTAPPTSVEVTEAPPPPQNEVEGNPPAPGEVWMPGYYQWNGRQHVWSRGRWSPPPQPGMAWDPPKWENRGGRYAFIEGRWHPAAPPAPTVVYEPPPPPPQVDVQEAPPPPIVEVRPQQPPNTTWIPGYWQWSGNRHTWVGGRWSAPKPGQRWQPDHWERRGAQYHFVRGSWGR